MLTKRASGMRGTKPGGKRCLSAMTLLVLADVECASCGDCCYVCVATDDVLCWSVVRKERRFESE